MHLKQTKRKLPRNNNPLKTLDMYTCNRNKSINISGDIVGINKIYFLLKFVVDANNTHYFFIDIYCWIFVTTK